MFRKKRPKEESVQYHFDRLIRPFYLGKEKFLGGLIGLLTVPFLYVLLPSSWSPDKYILMGGVFMIVPIIVIYSWAIYYARQARQSNNQG